MAFSKHDIIFSIDATILSKTTNITDKEKNNDKVINIFFQTSFNKYEKLVQSYDNVIQITYTPPPTDKLI